MTESKRPCPICGQLMKAWSGKKTCSHKCRMKAYRLRLKKGMRVLSTTKGTLCIRCDNCGEKIANPRLDQMHCSPKCKQAMYRQRKRFAAEDNQPKQLTFPESAYTISNSL